MPTLLQLAEQIDATYLDSNNGEPLEFTGAEIDNRRVQKGDLFVCIKGPKNDGHQYAKEAIQQGAAALLVERSLDLGVPEVIVEDSTRALGQLANVYRAHFKIPVIALTGSCGKTGTKEMIASILNEVGPTLATAGNFNNQFGVPLTLFKLKTKHDFAVIEMGTSGPGEIAYLAQMTRPTVAMITNISDQHVERLGSTDGISAEKSDIFKFLTDDGIAVINGDEKYAVTWNEKIGTHHRVGFSVEGLADLTISNVITDTNGSRFMLHTPIGNQTINVPLLGQHVPANALAAAAAALSVGAQLKDVAAGLSKVKPVKGRLNPYHLNNNITLIDDTYNAGPMAVKSAMQLHGQFEGKRIFVMSNMGELGDKIAHYHGALGQWAIDNDIDHLLLTGQPEFLQFTLDACDQRAELLNTHDLLFERLQTLITPNTTIIVKGSRANHMENIVQKVLDSKLAHTS